MMPAAPVMLPLAVIAYAPAPDPTVIRASAATAVVTSPPTVENCEASSDSAAAVPVAALFTSEDFVEGPLAFSQKRAPAWKGR